MNIKEFWCYVFNGVSFNESLCDVVSTWLIVIVDGRWFAKQRLSRWSIDMINKLMEPKEIFTGLVQCNNLGMI
jgi:hypothetical protein